jgi:glycosyltransferase involved in cell wall biosynthesis
MALGKPTVASRVGGVPEIVAEGETGFMVEPGHSGQLADRVVQLLQDRDLRLRLGRAGRARVENHFTVAHTIAGIETVFDELLRRQGSAA